MASAQGEQQLVERTLAQIKEVCQLGERLLKSRPEGQENHTSIEDLRKQVVHLRKRRDELRRRAKQTQIHTHAQSVAVTTSEAKADKQAREAAVAAVSASVQSAVQRRKAEEVHIAYTLAGHTVFPISPTRVGIRIHTAYGNQYFENFYVFLEMPEDSDDSPPSIARHTLPPFIPLDTLESLLGTSLVAFVSDVSDYVNAYVARREMCRQLEQTRGQDLTAQIMTSEAFDYVRFALKRSPQLAVEDTNLVDRLEIHLVYEDLQSHTPTHANVHACYKDADDDVRVHRLEKLFMTKPLLDAVAACYV